ncbi:TPA: plasmid replication initiation protein, partial [Shigella sonnei]|nr:plasmid replication initiation protein [Shigella sonnei]HAY7279270.1 plasmid replication initiation protein [Shigella sonnei]HAY7609421.1 plasmid replication initiation protein [Shigella sonnei]HAY7651200.1 plasmid replication initiation protein [Shigella sonnei]HAY7710177.1 plasmid replication initiation protein [Shigella sonnei]
SFGCGERYRLTDGDGNFLEDTRKTLSKEEIRPRRSRFSIGSAPLTSIAKSDAQISGGETRQDYKDPRRFPLVAPSCALLFLPFGLPVSFRCYGRGFSFHA